MLDDKDIFDRQSPSAIDASTYPSGRENDQTVGDTNIDIDVVDYTKFNLRKKVEIFTIGYLLH